MAATWEIKGKGPNGAGKTSTDEDLSEQVREVHLHKVDDSLALFAFVRLGYLCSQSCCGLSSRCQPASDRKNQFSGHICIWLRDRTWKYWAYPGCYSVINLIMPEIQLLSWCLFSPWHPAGPNFESISSLISFPSTLPLFDLSFSELLLEFVIYF